MKVSGLCEECNVKPCACNEKLDETSHFSKTLLPSSKELDALVVSDIDEWSRVNIWQTRKHLYLIEDINHQSGIVVDLKLMQNLARTFDAEIKRNLTKGDKK